MCDQPTGFIGAVINAGATLGSGLGSVAGPAGSKVGGFFGGGGVVGYAFCHFGGQCSRPPSQAYISAASYILAESIMRTVTKCEAATTVAQKVTANCSGNDPINSAGCIACEKARAAVFSNRSRLETEAMLLDSGYTPSVPTLDADPCIYACKSCVSEDIFQWVSADVTVRCEANNDFTTTVKSELSTSVSQAVSDVSDITGQIGRLLSSDASCVTAELTSRISSVVDTLDLSKFTQDAQATMNISITGSSVLVQKVQQRATVYALASFIDSSKIMDNIYSSSEMQVAQTALTSNAAFKDLLTSVSGTLSGLADLYSSSIGRAVLLIAVVAIGCCLIYILWLVIK